MIFYLSLSAERIFKTSSKHREKVAVAMGGDQNSSMGLTLEEKAAKADVLKDVVQVLSTIYNLYIS